MASAFRPLPTQSQSANNAARSGKNLQHKDKNKPEDSTEKKQVHSERRKNTSRQTVEEGETAQQKQRTSSQFVDKGKLGLGNKQYKPKENWRQKKTNPGSQRVWKETNNSRPALHRTFPQQLTFPAVFIVDAWVKQIVFVEVDGSQPGDYTLQFVLSDLNGTTLSVFKLNYYYSHFSVLHHSMWWRCY